jgi:hypothetical protein
MSTEPEAAQSAEDKFFGKTTTLDIGSAADGAGEDDIKVEVVDDQEPVQTPEVSAASDPDDEELANYSEKVQKRIKKMTYEKHEALRQRDEAAAQREEAIVFAQNLHQRTQQQEQIIASGEAELVKRIKAGAETAVESARARYKEAYDKGDTNEVIEAQEAMIRAQAEAGAAESYEAEYRQRQQQQQRQREYEQQQRRMPPRQPVQQPAPPEPTAKSKAWAEENPWFGEEKDMTALAYGVHERLVRDEGMDPNSDEYFQEIDRAIRQRFPEHFGQGQQARGQPASTSQRTPIVAAASREGGGSSHRTVKLKPSQIALAKRFGITNEQYAQYADKLK